MIPRRNLVLLLAHGLRSDALSDERAWPLSTPNMEDLAGRGGRLAANAACPVDGGGFVSVMTGMHARQHGQLFDGEARPLIDALPAWLRAAGCYVAAVGQVGPIASMCNETVVTEPVSVVEPKQCAYIERLKGKSMDGAVSQQRRQRLRSGPFEPDRLLMEPEDDIDGFHSSEALRVLQALPAQRPWVLIVAFSGPGNDLPPPTLYDGVVDAGELRGGFAPADFASLDAVAEPMFPRAMLQRLEPHQVARVRADYLGRVALIDYAVGRILEAVAKRADADRTWTLLASDRGHLLGEHGLIGQRSFLCGAVQTPLILAPPGKMRIDAEDHSDGLFSTVEVAPTAAAVMSADAPAAATGRNLLTMLRSDPTARTAAPAVLSEFGERLMLETDRYKVMFRSTDRRCIALYDLLRDPDERCNIAATPDGINHIDALRAQLADTLMPLRAANAA